MAELDFRILRSKRTPVILAVEAAECGLACLGMVAGHHGARLGLTELRQRYALSLNGATIRDLLRIADELGLHARAVQLDLGDLQHLTTPAILHWNFDHFVVLVKVRRDYAVIHDPALGIVRVQAGELSLRFTGVAIELAPTTSFRRREPLPGLKISDLWSSLDGFQTAFGQLVLMSIALQLIVFAAPFYIQLVIDQVIYKADLDLLLVLALAFGALAVMQASMEAVRGWTGQVVGHQMGFQVRGNVVRHLMRLPASFFEKRHVGDITSRVGATSEIAEILSEGLIATIIDVAVALAALWILFIYDTQLAALVVVALLLNLLVAACVFPSIRRQTMEKMAAAAREQTHLMESVRAATTIKIMGGEADREHKWRNLLVEAMNPSIRISKYQAILQSARTLIFGLVTVVIIYLAAQKVIEGAGFSAGMLFAFLAYRQIYEDRVGSIIEQSIRFRLLRVNLDRLSDILAEPAEITGIASMPQGDGAIALKGVGFRYGEGDPLILDNLDLEVRPGEYLGIVGPSGRGKTTLLKVLLGIQVPIEGEVWLNGALASPAGWRAWRGLVGVVAQDDRLLSGTIAENIGFFDPALDMVRVHEVAHMARISDDISRMPLGYLSKIGDMGAALSGGQKQRLLLARALYRRPKVLILDEGTANLDSATEEALADLIAELPITRIVVAHRPALLLRAHRVLTLTGGLLREVPTSMHQQRFEEATPNPNWSSLPNSS